ncbi:helix-turn-helix transcriptional regulator [Streptomyces sp. NPDC005209]|uniref:helix-turn-helix transcriptional regulator n=1 Tax=Streptomyces sp. NPDC005209 TaxID=3156715 RepID=UPI0033B24256
MRTEEALDTRALLRVAAGGLHREAAAAASLLRLLPPEDTEAAVLRARALVLAGRPEAALRASASVPPTTQDAPVRAAALRLLGRWDLAERSLRHHPPAATATALECAALSLDRGEPTLGHAAQHWAQQALHCAREVVPGEPVTHRRAPDSDERPRGSVAEQAAADAFEPVTDHAEHEGHRQVAYAAPGRRSVDALAPPADHVGHDRGREFPNTTPEPLTHHIRDDRTVEALGGIPDQADVDVDAAYARCLLAAAFAAVGRFGAALDAADAAAQAVDALGEDVLLRRLDAVHRLADALFYTGRRREAERRLGEALVWARESAQDHVAGRLELGLARARLAAQDLRAAGQWAERAAESARRTGGVPLAVDAALCLSRIRLAADDSAAALHAAEKAARAARPLGGVWRDRAAARLREVRLVREHERPAPPDEPERTPAADLPLQALSGREAQVAVLVSEGCTNQQIAARLQLSPKTVETHLSRIFKKLGITSRAQVAHWVGRAAGPARDSGG